ncbi:MAG: type IV pilus modification protein PilV [Gammaproteobacteria bacterium]|nr:type IV pilus modification protein PilV [Gammaproteobacteria bacterium]
MSLNNRQSGMGMIEALIALLIISIGLLGIAALQITSLQQSSSANWHSQAVWYNYEMTDRINANRDSLASYAGIDTAGSYGQDCQATDCTSQQMVNADAQEWQTLVGNLPEGRGFVSQNGDLVTVSVMWNDGADATNCINGEADSANMTCFTVTMQ